MTWWWKWRRRIWKARLCEAEARVQACENPYRMMDARDDVAVAKGRLAYYGARVYSLHPLPVSKVKE